MKIERIHSIDIARGIVMAIMALDHVRDYFSMTGFAPENLDESNTALFFTRWITHFCAPTFVFLSGVSAWLHIQSRSLTRMQGARFLISRGLWLVFIELTVVSLSWQFAYNMLIAQVIWAIGWSMIVLGLLLFVPRVIVIGLTVGMLFGHNLLDAVTPADWGSFAWLWHVLHVQTQMPLFFAGGQGTPAGLFIAYPLIPWIGIMSAGYLIAPLFTHSQAGRDAALMKIGALAIVAFILLRSLGVYGEPGLAGADAVVSNHGKQGFMVLVMSFLNTTKYPPSLLFTLMTLGPLLLLLPALERMRGGVASFFSMFGKVPFFFYVLHIPLIHALHFLWVKIQFGQWGFNPFFGPFPADYEPALWRAYLVWILVIALLYYPCRWFMRYRQTHRRWWLSYL